MTNLLSLKKDLNTQELAMLSTEIERRKKSRAVLWVLWLFTGTIGGHRYYLGDKGRALLQTIVFILAIVLGFSLIASAENEVEALIYGPMALFMFLSVPALWAIIDAFFIGRRLARKNEEIEISIIKQIKSMRSTTTAPPAP
jgi:TM2 domain-containing membrane protein YozV